MATVKRSDIRQALRARLGQFHLQNTNLRARVQRVRSLNTVPLPVVLGEPATDRLLDELLEELGKQLGTEQNLIILD